MAVAVASAVAPRRAEAQGSVALAPGDSALTAVLRGQTVAIPILVLPSGGMDIRTLSNALVWFTTALKFDSVRTGPFGTVTPNTVATGSGALLFSATRGSGQTQRDTIATAYFTADTGTTNRTTFALHGGTPLLSSASAATNGASADILRFVLPLNADVCVVSGPWGDVNNDGIVNIIDAQQLARNTVGLAVLSDSGVLQRGDVNADGVANILDAQQIARRTVGLSAAARIGLPAYVAPVVDTVVIGTGPGESLAAGESIQFAAVPTGPGPRSLLGCRTVTWTSSDPTKATVTASGFAQGLAAGSTTITASSGGKSTSFELVVGAAEAVAIVADSGKVPPQSVTVGQTLPIPFVARVIDAFGNPVAGVTVQWSTGGTGGGTLIDVSMTTDAAGRVRATLQTDAPAGTYNVVALANGVATPLTFTATSVNVVANKVWNGATSTNWHDASNWTPSGVPAASDSVTINPGGNQPALTADAVSRRLTVQSGATLNLGTFQLVAGGSVNVPATGVSGSGKIRMNGANVTVAGGFTNLDVFGGVTTAVGAVTVSGTLTVSAGRYDVGVFTTTVGTLSTSGTGAPRMTAGGDLVVNTAANWNSSGVYSDTLLTAGTLRIKGSWNVGCNAQVFSAAATHTTSFEGTGAQIVAGGCSAGVGSPQEHFGRLTIANPAGVSVSGTIAMTGLLTINAGASLNGGNAILLGSAINAAGTYGVTNTTFHGVGLGTTSTMPALTYNTLTLNNPHVFVLPASGWIVTNALIVQNSAVLDVSSGAGTAGSLTVNSGGKLRMRDPSGSLTVNGLAQWNSTAAWGDSLLTAGTIRARGNWGMACNSAVFNAAGTHTVSFEGTAAQTVNVGCSGGPAATAEHFRHVVIANTAAIVSFPSGTHATGTVTVNAGANLGGGGTLIMRGAPLVNNGTYSISNTIFHGTGGTSTLPAFTIPGVTLDSAHVFQLPASGFAVTSGMTLSNGVTLDVGAGSALVGALSVGTAAKLRMQNPAGTFTINGTATMNSAGVWGDSLLTAGTLHVKGNWNPGCNSHVFNASGTHTVNFSGAAAQSVSGSCSQGTGESQEHFRNVVVSNTGGAVSFPGVYFATGTVTVDAGATASGGGTWHVDAGALANSGTYSVTNTTFHGTGSTTTLPAFTLPSLVLDGAHNFELPTSGFGVSGTLTLQNSTTLDVLGNSATVGALSLQSSSKLRMHDPAGSLTINGTATMNSPGVWGDSLLTAGTLHVKGTWSPGCNSHVFNASGTHTVNFSGTATQTVNNSCTQGTGVAQEHFRNVVVSNTAASVSFPGTYFATGTVTVNAGATASGGGTWHLDAGTLVNNGAYTVTNTTFHGTGSTTTLPAFTLPSLVLDGAHNFELPASGFGVTGTLTLQNNTALNVLGNSATVGALSMQTSSKLRMQHPAGVLTVNGTTTMNSPGVWGDSLLTAGTLHVKGTWSPGCNSHVFNASGTHTVNFSGTAAQTVNNSCTQGTGVAQEHFRNVVVSNTGGAVSFPGVYFATGAVTVNTGATASGAGTWHLDAGTLVNNGAYTVTNTTFHGTGSTTALPGIAIPNLVLDGAHNFELPASGFGVSGTLTLQNSTTLDVLGNSATVGALSMQSSSKLRMQNPAGSLTVNGTATMNSVGVWGDSLLTAGTLHVKGAWSPGCNSHVFNASGTHTVNFSGTAAQTVNNSCSQGTGVSQEHFRNLVVSNAAGAVSFPGTYFATGIVTVDAGATASGGGTWHVDAGALTNNGTYSVANTTFHGTAGTTTLPAFTLPSLVLDGAHTFELPASGFGVTGTLTLQNGTSLNVLGNSATVGALSLQSSSKLRMQNPAGVLTVNGTATMNSVGVWGDSLLTAGTLYVKGTWSPGCNTYVFNASGTHTVNFSGTAAQTVNNSCSQGSGVAQEHFRNVVISNTGGAVSFPGTYFISGSLSVDAGATASGGGTLHVDAGALTNNGTYTVSNTTLHGIGGTTTLPAFSFPSLVLDGVHKHDVPASGFGVTGALTAQNGAVLDVAAGSAAVGSLTMNTSSRLRMTQASGNLTVNGGVTLFATGVPYRDTSVVAGTLRVSGSISATCGLEAFNARGAHIIEIFGSGNTSIGSCATADTSKTGFHLNELRVNKSSGTLTLTSVDVMGRLRVQSGTFSASGVSVWDSVEVTGGTLTGPSLTYRKTGQVIPNNTVASNTVRADASIGGGVTSGSIVVDSALLDHTGSATIAGNLFLGNGGRLRMATANTLTINGNATFQGGSEAGLLQAGRLELKGSFSQGVVSTSFAADSAHRTAFIGTGLQTISFANAGSTLSRFNDLELANISANGTQIQSTNVVAKGNLIVPAAAGDTVRLTTSGVVNLSVGGVDVSGVGSTRFKISGARLTISSASSNGSIAQFDNVTFGSYAVSDNQLTFDWTPPGVFTFTGLKFTTVPNGTSGHYVVMNSGISTSLTLASASPSGVTSPLTSIVSGILNWP